jgi:hypothetical protein
MSTPEESFLVCLPVTVTTLIVPGSTKTDCTDCGQRVWVSAASLALSKAQGARIICMDCANKRAATDEEVEVQPPTEEQLREIRDAIERG